MNVRFAHVAVLLGLAAAILAAPRSAEAQEWGIEERYTFGFGASLDLASGFVWRGIQFSDAANIQPGVWLTYGPFELGTWASRSLSGDFHEQDIWLTYYTPESATGQFYLTLNDYYIDDSEAGIGFPDDFFDYRGTAPCEEEDEGFGFPPRCARGMHYLDLTIGFQAAALPLEIVAAYNIHNDPEQSFYGEASLTPSVAGFDLGFTAGGVFGRSEWYYEADGASFINLAASAGRTIEIGNFSVPLMIQGIHNPSVGGVLYVARAGVAVEW